MPKKDADESINEAEKRREKRWSKFEPP